jgi:hypothetical protein
MSDEPNSDLLNPNCQKCKGSEEIIHVITHECLEGDALRCVIKGVPNSAPLDPDDYVKVSDLLEYVASTFNVPSASTGSAIDAPTPTISDDTPAANSFTDVAPSVVTPAPSSDAVASDIAVPTDGSVITITATAGMLLDDCYDSLVDQRIDDGSATITTTATIDIPTNVADWTESSAGYVSSGCCIIPCSDSPLSTPFIFVSSYVPTLVRSDSSSPSTIVLFTTSTETPSPTFNTIVESTVSCKMLCTTFYQTTIVTISVTPTPSTGPNVFIPFQGSFSQLPNSHTVYAPPGDWPFQRTSTLTSTDSPTATPSIDSARINRILRPAGRPAGNRVADGRVKDAPLAKMLHGGIIRRDSFSSKSETNDGEEFEFNGFTPAGARSVADIFSNYERANLRLPQLVHREHKNEARSNIKISQDIARIILNTDETLNPNSALLHKLRPHLAMSPREVPIATGHATATEMVPATMNEELYPHETYVLTPEQYYDRLESAIARPTTHFHVASPYDKAILGLLCAVVVGGIVGFVSIFVKKRKATPFSRV